LDSRAGAILYLTLLLAWVVFGYSRRHASRKAAGDPATEARTLVLFVAGWAIILMAIGIAWWLFHQP